MKYFIILLLSFIFTSASQAADSPTEKFYKYAHNDSEYTILLPEAPSVKTIWADAGSVPYLESPPEDGALGEIAAFHRKDEENEDYFDAKITFLKADAAFLTELTQEKMQAALEADAQSLHLENKKSDFSAGGNKALRWATLTGFSVDKSNRPFYNAFHYLTGQQSITVIKVQYSVENETFADYNKRLTDSISYLAP